MSAPRRTCPELYACIYARAFAAQAVLRLRPELLRAAVAVLDGEPPLQRVCAMNAKARRCGVVDGMTPAEMETFPQVTLRPRSLPEEAMARAALLECAGTFSPRVENRSHEGYALYVVDIAGTDKLFGPPPLLARQMHTRVQAIGIHASIAVAGNFEAAICLARGMELGRDPNQRELWVVGCGGEGQAMASLPLSVLELSPHHAETLSLWGIGTCGELAKLPEADLVSRLGQEGKRLQLLARGEATHLFTPTELALTLEERMELDAPVELLESLLFVAGVMLEQLILRASCHVLALAAVTLTLTLEGKEPQVRTLRPALPTNDRQLWLKLLHLDLQAYPPGAAVLALVLGAQPGSISKVQLGLFAPQTPEPGRLEVTLARIRAIVGEEYVGTPLLKDTHRPDGFAMQPSLVPSSRGTSRLGRPNSAARRLRPPVTIAVVLAEHQPKSFFFREKHYSVEHAYGPWSLAGEWWAGTWLVQRRVGLGRATGRRTSAPLLYRTRPVSRMLAIGGAV